MEQSSDDLYIDGKPVTEANARRFVQARRPNAVAKRETERVGFRRFVRIVIKDRTAGAPGWINASADTAGKAWLRVARQMVEHDKKVAADRRAMDEVLLCLREAAQGGGASYQQNLEAAALRYAAERVSQSNKVLGGDRGRCVAALLELAAEPTR